MKLEITLTESDADRLWAVKEMQGKADLTASEFAGELLASYIRRLYPGTPKFDDLGKLTK